MPGRKLIVEITGDTKSLERALGKAGKETETFGSTLGKVGKTAGLAAGAAGIGALTIGLKIGIGEWKESTRVANQTQAVLKSTGGVANVTAKHVDTLATSIMNYSGIDDEAIKSGENLLLTFTNIRNSVGKGNDIFDQATTAITDMSVALGQSMKSSAIQLGKALNDPIKGITALRRVGVSFTDAQKDQIKTLVESGKTVKAQKIILAELTKEFGGSAKAAGETLPGQLNIAKEKFNNFAGDLVAKTIPALERAVSWLKDHWPEINAKLQEFWSNAKPIITGLANIFDALWPSIKRAFDVLIELVQDFTRVIKGMVEIVSGLLHGDFSQVWQGIKDVVGGVIESIKDEVSGAAGIWWNALKGPLDTVFVQPFTDAWNAVAGWFGKAEGFVSKVAGYIGGLPGKAWAAYVAVFETIYVKPFKAAWGAVADWFVSAEGFVTKVVGYVAGIPGKIAAKAQSIGAELLGAVQSFFTSAQIGPWISTKVGEFANFFGGLPGKLVDKTKDVGAGLLSAVQGFFTQAKIGDWISGRVQDYADFFGDLPKKIGEAVKGGVQAGKKLLGEAVDAIFGKLGSWVRGILDIKSPSKEFADIGQQVIAGMVEGLKSSAFNLKDTILDIVKKYVVDVGFKAFEGWTSEMWDELSNLAGDVGTFFSDVFGGGATGVANGFAVLPELPTTTHETLGLAGYPAADIMLPAGTVVGSPSHGSVTRTSGRPFSEGWSNGPGSAIGLSMYIAGRVADYFLTHFDRMYVGAGATIGRGTPIGTVGPMDAYGVASHIHEGVHRLAAGGIVTRPTFALVGEAGPEAVIPLGKYRGGGGPSVIQLVLDGRVLAEAVRKQDGRWKTNNALA